jgi:hypothetical protein
MQMLAAVVAAVIHDYQHPLVSNTFLCQKVLTPALPLTPPCVCNVLLDGTEWINTCSIR